MNQSAIFFSTNHVALAPSTRAKLWFHWMGRSAFIGLLVSAITLTCFPGCNSESQPTKINSPGGVTSSPAKNTMGAQSKESETKQPIDVQKTPPTNQVNAANQTDKSAGATVDQNDKSLMPFEAFELLSTLEAGFLSVDAIAFAPDGKTFVTCADTPKIWEFGAAEPLHEFDDIYPLTGTVVEPEAVTISKDGKLLAFAGGDGIIYLFDYASREAKHQIEAHEQGVVSLSFSDDGKKIASSGYDGQAKIWNTQSGELIAACDVQKERRVRSALAPDGSYLVTAGEEAEIWDPSSGNRKLKLDIGESRAMGVWFVDITQDGNQIVTGDATKDFENAAMVWSADSGKLVATLKHEYGVGQVAFSPDGNWLATGDMNGETRVWRLADSKLVQSIKTEDVFRIDSIQWTHDGRALAVASDGTIRFWGLPGAVKPIAVEQGKQPDDDWSYEPEVAPDIE